MKYGIVFLLLGLLLLVCISILVSPLAQLLAGTPLGTELLIQGFLAAARKDSVKVKLHMQQARKVGGSAGHDPLVA